MSDKPLGYQRLVEKYQLEVIPPHRTSYLLGSGIQRTKTVGGQLRVYYPASYWPGERDGAQLEFALKYEGLNSGFACGGYEYLTGQRLEIEDLKQGNYVDLPDRRLDLWIKFCPLGVSVA